MVISKNKLQLKNLLQILPQVNKTKQVNAPALACHNSDNNSINTCKLSTIMNDLKVISEFC